MVSGLGRCGAYFMALTSSSMVASQVARTQSCAGAACRLETPFRPWRQELGTGVGVSLSRAEGEVGS